jgi:hypothetical protein
MAPPAKRIPTSILKRHLAGGESLATLAADVNLTRQAFSKRLKSAPIQKRLLALEAGPEQPAATHPASSKGNQPRPPSTPVEAQQTVPDSDYEGLAYGETRQTVSTDGTHTSFACGGKGRMTVGWKRDRTPPPARVTLYKRDRSGARRAWTVIKDSDEESWWRSRGFA